VLKHYLHLKLLETVEKFTFKQALGAVHHGIPLEECSSHREFEHYTASNIHVDTHKEHSSLMTFSVNNGSSEA